MILTRNHALLAAEVKAHVEANAVVQGQYWGDGKGCFIGCLAHSANPKILLEKYGLPEPLVRICEGIFERLTKREAVEFFASVPGAVGCDGKDLSRLHWRFLAQILRDLPKVPDSIQAVIDPVIEGMDSLADDGEWPADAARAAADAARAAAYAARAAAYAADAVDVPVLAARAAYVADVARTVQRDLILRLISEAPIHNMKGG